MSKDESLNNDELEILKAIRENPDLKSCFLEMIDIPHSPLGKLDLGDDAEEAVVNSIRKTGAVLLRKWAERKNKELETIFQKNQNVRYHEKKN
jgi:hypothetical protein